MRRPLPLIALLLVGCSSAPETPEDSTALEEADVVGSWTDPKIPSRHYKFESGGRVSGTSPAYADVAGSDKGPQPAMETVILGTYRIEGDDVMTTVDIGAPPEKPGEKPVGIAKGVEVTFHVAADRKSMKSDGGDLKKD